MVSRSTATLNSLNGWPGDGAEPGAAIVLAVQVLDAFHLQVADEILRPSSIWIEHRDIAGLAAGSCPRVRVRHLHVAEAVRLVEVRDGFLGPAAAGSRCTGRAGTAERWPVCRNMRSRIASVVK